MIKIVIVDDDTLLCKQISDYSARLSAETTCFHSVTSLKEEQDILVNADIVLLDLCIGAEDGIEALHHLAEQGCTAGVVLISGMDAKVLRTAERIGVDLGLRVLGALEKPFGMQHLAAMLEAAPAVSDKGNTVAGDERALHAALINGELTLHYQPKIDLSKGGLGSIEALARWQHPERGLLPPSEFIPVAERTGLIVPLTYWAVGEAIRQIAAWRQDGLLVGVALNVPCEMLNNNELPRIIEEALSRHDVPGDAITLEVTETEVMRDTLTAMDVLTRLRLKGIGLSIDDFGTGTSSLQKLLHLPFSELKIDKAFVSHADTDADARLLNSAVIDLAHKLGLRVVAEGVETRPVFDELERAGCDAIQGFLIAKPMPADALAEWAHTDAPLWSLVGVPASGAADTVPVSQAC